MSDAAKIRENITQSEVIHNLMLLAMEYADDFTDKQRFWRGLVDEITERMLPVADVPHDT